MKIRGNGHVWFLSFVFFLFCFAPSVFGATIDVMIVYDSTAKSWVDSNGGMTAFAKDAVERMNQAMANSGVNLTFRLVHTAEVSYTHSMDLSKDLTRLQAGYENLSIVHQWRDTYSADIIAMFVDTGSASGPVGNGYILCSYSGDPEYAFSTNAIRSVNISHTLTHEVGHNLGCDHSKYQTDSPGPNTALNTYSAGWYFQGTNFIKYNTIMAYYYDGYGNTYTEAPLFSTPLLNYQGIPAGHAQDGDNARNIRETMDVVAAYRQSNLPTLNAPTLSTPADNATDQANNVSLTWLDTNSSPQENGYEVRIRPSGGSYLYYSKAQDATSHVTYILSAGVTYYWSVKAVGNGTSTQDSDYPADRSFTVGNTPESWSYDGLWHQIPDTSSPTGRSFTSTTSNTWWYGRDATGNYDTGVANIGSIISPSYSISAGQSLKFYSWEETENYESYDTRKVYVSIDGGITWALIKNLFGNEKSWYEISIDLAAYAGKNVKFKFTFDTFDAFNNNYSGWYIDDIQITSCENSGEKLSGDFNGDGNQDILWRNSQTGQVNVWLTNPASIGILSKGTLGTVADMNWEIIGVGNFNASTDTTTDILWRNKQTGQVNVWLINGTAVLNKGTLGTVSDLNWGIINTGDFNADSNTDLLWRNKQTGQVNVWLTNPASIGVLSKGSPGTVADLNWEIIGVGNFNTSTDTKTDILWRNKQTGQVNVWLINGTAKLSSGTLGTVSDLNWGIVNTGDFNADSNTDLLWRNSQTGQINIWLTNPASISVSGKGTLGTVADKNWGIIGVGDFNASDTKTDILWRNKQTGQVNVWLINGTALLSKGTLGTVSDLNWGIINTGNFNTGSNTDLLWRNSQTGQVNVWLTNPAAIGVSGKGTLGTVSDMNWEIQ